MKIDINNEYYPEKLRKIKNPPQKLHILGNIEIINNFGIAIIGSRNCTTYGERMTKIFTKKLNKYNLNIISGMALGIDKYAHLTTIEECGTTIAVLPSGFNNIYPKENIFLVDKILSSGGTLISEYEPNETASSSKFLERNRIISGLSDGVLIVEGGYRSGTSVTARIAKEQYKKIFCVPSSLENSKGLVTNSLIRKGAILVRDEKDILENYEKIEYKKTKKDDEKTQIQNKKYKVLNILNGEMDINEIINKSNLKIDEVNYQLTILQLNNLIEQVEGNKYRRIIL